MKIAPNISWKKLQDKVVAVNLTTGTYYTMNVVASTIWNFIADGKSPEEIARTLADEYDQAEEEIFKDLNTQIDYWKKENLLAEE